MSFKLDDKTLDIYKNHYRYFYSILDDFYYMHNSYKEITEELTDPYQGCSVTVTPEETIRLAREVLTQINIDYVKYFDDLLNKNKILIDEHFGESRCNGENYRDVTTWRIEIKDNKDYYNVVTLIHEFMHYCNRLSGNSNCREFFGEYISIYFEKKALEILLNMGIPKEDLNYEWRVFATRDLITINIDQKNGDYNPDNERYPRRVYSYFLHLLGQFLGEVAIKNNVTLEEMVKLNNNINNFDNYDQVFNIIGFSDYKVLTDEALACITERINQSKEHKR